MKSFICSLCHNGILGGGLYIDIAFQNKKRPKGIGEISDAFLIKICSDRLTNSGK